jgi:hypothetical protein
MVYICYIIYRDYVVTSVLAVGDNELAVGDDDDASSEVAGGRGTCRSAQSTHVDRQAVTRRAGSGLPALLGTAGTET